MSFRYMETIIGPRFIVVIPCYNEEKYVNGLLEDLCQQTMLPDLVVVADCDSEDNTVEVVKRYQDRLPLEIVRSTGRSSAAARNSAAAATNCNPEDYLVFVDADVRLQADFIQKLRTETRKHPVDCVTPTFRCDGMNRIYWLSMCNNNFYHRHIIGRRHRVAGKASGMVVRKGMHDLVGGFPESASSSDMWYVARFNRAGATSHYAEDIYVVNSSRRIREDGVLGWFLAMTPDESLVARLHGLLSPNGIRKAYGHYGRKP